MGCCRASWRDSARAPAVVPMHAEIAGAGFGGLVAAIALARRGWSVRVHERTPFVRSEGYGIAIHRNGILVLQALGAFDEILQGSVRVSHLETRRADGSLTSQVPARLTYRISRQHMIGVLSRCAQQAGVEVLVDSEVDGAQPDGQLCLKDGTRLAADLVIGADGVHSRVRDSLDLLDRRSMLPDGAMRFVFQVDPGATGIDPVAGAPAIEYWSGSRRLIWNACAPDQIYVAMSCLASDATGQQVPLDATSWQQAFPALAPQIARMAASVDWDSVKWVRFQTIHLKRWSAGKVAVLGDAAHAMPPNLGQGGGCAMMNAWSLANAVADAGSIPEALAAWEQRERPLTEHTQRWSRMYSATTVWPAWMRSAAFFATGRVGWLRSQYQKTANHIPVGLRADAV